MTADWTAIKLARVSDSHSIRELVQCFEANAASLMRRAAEEDWQVVRQQNSAKVSNSADLLINEVQPSELAASN
jgi:hypothetical protein